MRLDKDNTINLTPYGFAKDLIQVYGSTYNGKLGESLIQILAHSTLDSFSNTQEGIVRVLYYLNARVESVRKTISTWDAYQIKGTLQDRDTMLSEIAALPANSSVINNIEEPFQWTNQEGKSITLHKGDVLFKDSEGYITFIKSLSSGYYAPTKVSQVTGNNFTIDYHYFTQTPEEGSKTADAQHDIEDPAMIHKLPVQITGEAQGYNKRILLKPYNETGFTDDTTDIISGLKPVIKYYVSLDNGNIDGDQIFFDIPYTIDNNKIVVTNYSSIEVVCEVK